jgi:predicted permease
LLTLDAGFDRRNVLVVGARAPWFAADTIKVPPDRREVVYEEVVGRLRAIPGVVAVARGYTTPIGDDNWFTSVSMGAATDPRDEPATAFFNFVTPGYFATLRIPVLAGRDVDDRDTKHSSPVAVVNESFARLFLPGVAPLGRTFRRGSEPAAVEIVGIVKDSKYETLRDAVPPTVFLPAAQAPRGAEAEQFILRTSIPPSLVTPVLRRVLADVNRDIPLAFRTLDERVSDHLTRERALATLAGFFGAVALLLAMIGLYGVLSYLVAHRQAEFGIRIALGAEPVSIRRLIMKDVVLVLAAGLTAGLVVAMMTVTALDKLLFGLEPRDTPTTLSSVMLLSAMALLAGYVPARRATRVNPAVALRSE